MHEANFELIEIPHVRQSGKNSADIRMVVDALDLCYTKSHVNTFVIITGDSDFSPLVSKLRENDKQVIGVGVKNSTSDLLVANCDEFIFYDDLVREERRAAAKRDERKRPAPASRSAAAAGRRRATASREETEARKHQARRAGGRDLRRAGLRARRQRQDLGLAAEGHPQAPQARLQRNLLRLPHLRQPAGRGAGARPARSSAATKSPAPMCSAAAAPSPAPRRRRRRRPRPRCCR